MDRGEKEGKMAGGEGEGKQLGRGRRVKGSKLDARKGETARRGGRERDGRAVRQEQGWDRESE